MSNSTFSIILKRHNAQNTAERITQNIVPPIHGPPVDPWGPCRTCLYSDLLVVPSDIKKLNAVPVFFARAPVAMPERMHFDFPLKHGIS